MSHLTIPWREQIAQPKSGLVGRLWQAFFQGVSDREEVSPYVLRSVTLETQSASVAATAFPGVTIAPGMYRVSAALQVTTAATTSSSLILTLHWTSRGVACSMALTAMTSNSAALPASHVVEIYADGDTDIEYEFTYASVGATAMVYAADVALEPVPFNGESA